MSSTFCMLFCYFYTMNLLFVCFFSVFQQQLYFYCPLFEFAVLFWVRMLLKGHILFWLTWKALKKVEDITFLCFFFFTFYIKNMKNHRKSQKSMKKHWKSKLGVFLMQDGVSNHENKTRKWWPPSRLWSNPPKGRTCRRLTWLTSPVSCQQTLCNSTGSLGRCT